MCAPFFFRVSLYFIAFKYKYLSQGNLQLNWTNVNKWKEKINNNKSIDTLAFNSKTLLLLSSSSNIHSMYRGSWHAYILQSCCCCCCVSNSCRTRPAMTIPNEKRSEEAEKKHEKKNEQRTYKKGTHRKTKVSQTRRLSVISSANLWICFWWIAAVAYPLHMCNIYRRF